MLSAAYARMPSAAALGAALALVGAAPAAAEPRELEVDIAHTAVFWKVSHGGISTVTGQFRKIDLVEITFDPDDVANSRSEHRSRRRASTPTTTIATISRARSSS